MTTLLSDSERAARADANAKASAEALRLAGEARERDTLAGQKPVVAEVAESLAARLKNELPETYDAMQAPVSEENSVKLVFFIDPVPASRPRVPRFGKPYYLPTYENFRQKMAIMVRKIPKPLFDQELRADITFYKLIPVSFSKKRREQMHDTYCVSNFDLDNLEKAIYDALNGHVYIDDCQIVEHSTRKKWTMDQAHIKVNIEPL